MSMVAHRPSGKAGRHGVRGSTSITLLDRAAGGPMGLTAA